MNGFSDTVSVLCKDIRALTPADFGGELDAIVSNPPYIRTDVIETLETEAKTEPRAALDGGADGLIFYRSIVKNFAKNLEDGGFFLFEIGYDQADDLKKIASDNGFSCEIYKDLGGCDRAALLRKM